MEANNSVPTPYFAQCLLNTRPMLVQSKELDKLCIRQMRLLLQTRLRPHARFASLRGGTTKQSRQGV